MKSRAGPTFRRKGLDDRLHDMHLAGGDHTLGVEREGSATLSEAPMPGWSTATTTAPRRAKASAML